MDDASAVGSRNTSVRERVQQGSANHLGRGLEELIAEAALANRKHVLPPGLDVSDETQVVALLAAYQERDRIQRADIDALISVCEDALKYLSDNEMILRLVDTLETMGVKKK